MSSRSVETPTHCPYCGLQCAMTLTRDDEAIAPARTVQVGGRSFPTNRGGLCQKGWTSADLLRIPDRLLTPLVRVAGTLQPTDWETALDVVADGVRRARECGGADAVAVFGGGALTNEKAYTLGKFARVALGTANIDYNGRFCMSSAAAASIKSFGVDRGLPFPVSDLTTAHAVLLFGANIAETMPPLVRHVAAAADRGGLIVVDPRRTPTAERALAGGGVHLQPSVGTDLPLALGMLRVALVEGYLDRAYIDTRTTGFDAARAAAGEWWPERTERVTGVPIDRIRRAVAIVADARQRDRGAYILSGRGAEQHATGTDTVSAIIAVALALGLPGRERSGYGTITGQGNGQGGRELGQKADQLPGYRTIVDPAARRHVASVWGVDPDQLPGPGKSAYELLDALGAADGPRMLLVHGSNPVVSAPRSQRIVDRLAALDLLVVSDFVLSETAAVADVVLPVLQWAEEDGTTTSLEGRVLRRRRAVAPPVGPRSDLEVLAALAIRLGQPASRFATEPRAVFDEIGRASAGGVADYSGIDYDRLDREQAVHWPCPDAGHPGTPRMFLDGFATPDGRARFVGPRHRGAAETVDATFPLVATTGRIQAHYQSGSQTRRVDELRSSAGEMFVQVHPDTAQRAGLANGDLARVVGRRGVTVGVVRCDESMRPDTVFLPFHFPGDARANLVTSTALDPTSRMPEFKSCVVHLEAATTC